MTQRLDDQKPSAPAVRAIGGVYMQVMNSGLPKTLLDLVFLACLADQRPRLLHR